MLFPLVAFIIGAFANTVLAGIVLRRNSQSATHRLFAALSIALIFWATVNYISFSTTNYTLALWSIRLVMASAILQSVIYALLMHTFPRSTFAIATWGTALVTVAIIAGIAITLSPFLYPSIEFQQNRPPQPTRGWGMGIIFLPIVLGSLLWGLRMLIKKNIQARGIERLQQRYLLVGLLLTFGLFIVLLYFANIKKDTRLVPYAPLFTLPFVSMTAYAIVRYRLMDIRAVIFRALGFAALSGSFFIAYGLLVYALTEYLGRLDLSPLQHAVLAIAAIALAVPSYHYFRRTLQKVTDRFLFQNRVDYRRSLVELGEALARTIEINEVTTTILNALKNIVRCRKAAILLQTGPGNGMFVPSAHFGMERFNVTIPRNNELIKHLQHAASGPLVRDELAVLKERETSTLHIKELETIEHNLDWLDASIVIPLFVNRQLTGILLVGDKLSGQPYLQDDIEFLAGLAPQAATALENARLYEESRQFGKKLQEEVERATHDLAMANEQLKKLDRAKSEFLSIASHQMYTPLTALRGYLSMMQEGDYGRIPEKQQPVISKLGQSAVRLIDLIRNLLDVSRIESGRLELNLELVDLTGLAQELVGELLPNAKEKKMRLVLDKPAAKTRSVIADRQRIRQVILNFIDNAIKYTRAGSIQVAVNEEGDNVLCSVSDTGRGMTREEIGMLFIKFSRLGANQHTRPEGTGLGLYFAKQIALEHHGDVTAESKGHGKGSTFSLRLPAADTPRSLKLGEKMTVAIKAAESNRKEKASPAV